MKYYKNCPKLNDDIFFDLNTIKNGIIDNPYSFEKITIYYLEKSTRNKRKLEVKFHNNELEQIYNQQQTEELYSVLDNEAYKTNIYYDNAKIIMSTVSPLWTEDGKTNKVINAKDKDSKLIKGKFIFVWKPQGMREGTYVIRWEWKNSEKGKTSSSEKIFSIGADEAEPLGHNLKLAPRDKYDELLLKYIPLMYYKRTKKNDLTPEVIEKLNKAVSQGFLEIDDLATKTVTLLDPETINENFLPLLANFFSLTLRSDNKGAWRNQIKHALNLYKQKGTLEGLRGALDKAGVRLINLTNLWQVVSPFTWTDAFVIEEDFTTTVGYLTKRPLDTDFEISLRSVDRTVYNILPNDVITLQDAYIPELRTAVIWHGDKDSLSLLRGDIIKIKYKYNTITEKDQTIEEYIQKSLPLADSRDEKDFKYPLKNWNVRLIEEDDPAFNLLVQERHPLTTPVVFGKVRTTFLYSEKVWNMDTFNGSLQNSNNPCDIDKDFLDTCQGLSSKFNVHLEMEEITDEKVKEVKNIITDYSPFHAMLNNIKISSKFTDIILPPEEVVKAAVNKKNKNSDKIQTTEAIYCEIRFKDGRKMQGQIV